jgi:DNA-binding MarR family transcriptional regulator
MGDVQWLDDEEYAAWRGWLRLAARVHAALGRDLLRDHGLSEPEYAVLVHLSESPDHRVRMSDLALGLDWSKSRLSHLVGRMEQRGLVHRRDCVEDGRGSFAALTETGMAEITRAAPAHVASVRRHFFDHLDREQVRQLAALTTEVMARLDATGEPCPAGVDALPTGASACPGSDEVELEGDG